MRKIGIFGGSFDPVHFGHLRPALEILEALSLDHLRFIPSGLPPHRAAPVADAAQRLAMLKAAVADEPRFQVDERELRRKAPSYSFDTLAELRREHPEDRLVFALGLDAFLGFTAWHRWQELLGLTHLVVAHRPGSSLDGKLNGGEIARLVQERGVDDADTLFAERAGRLMFLPVTQLEISSSRVRETAARGGDLRWLVPDAVRTLIQDSHCYG